VQTDIISNQTGVAAVTNPALLNPSGIAFGPGGDFWIDTVNNGLSLLVDGTGAPTAGLPQVAIPLPAPPLRADAGPTATPTGIIWNGALGFSLPGTTDNAIFIFDTEDGTISAWNPAVNVTNAVLVVDNSKVGTGGAVYKGLAFGVTVTGPHLYATNFRAGTIDVYDQTFAANLVDGAVPSAATATNITGTFADPRIPAGFAPFNIQNVNGDLYVTYAKQNTAKHDPVAGAHLGFVDVFSADGVLLKRFAAGGALNAPWGVVQAPAGFGDLGSDILVGNFGDGTINAFSPAGEPLGPLQGTNGKSLVNPGLWTLVFGNALKASPDTLFFCSGPNNQANGLFGMIAAQ
jgi:uncharacterized protein (TIGR03118 family)